MDEIRNFLGTETFLIIMAVMMCIITILLLILVVKTAKLNSVYKKFMKKVGNGENIQEDLENFMHIVERVEKDNINIIANIKNIEKDISKCIQKIGIVRYSAFKDTGSDLSFALAMLDEQNNGVILNGIYSREISNIYGKPIINGKSQYILSEEEQDALNKAINEEIVYKINE